ncbi:MAG: hypothetical protein DMG40_26995 [Acidobacteria bacterium]|nr:MAG: hypothetical protein DMG40_26995 [Acidobacteriota bacterium]
MTNVTTAVGKIEPVVIGESVVLVSLVDVRWFPGSQDTYTGAKFVVFCRVSRKTKLFFHKFCSRR